MIIVSHAHPFPPVGGLPIGLHITGAHGQESLVLQASAAYEEAHPRAHLHPPVS